MDYLMQQRLDDLFFEADGLIKQGKYTEAISILEAILIECPEFGKAYNHLAWILETKFFDYSKAIEHYEKCLIYSPNYTPVYTNMSVALSTMRRFDEQERVLSQALNIPGIDRASIQNELGIMHELCGDYEKAQGAFREAVKCTLSDVNLELYIKNIERCNRKKQVLS